ncbi:DinB family protein [Fictibacillus aquaticus]|nr:DinB family protein [Fictibacillus aquaticus]
MTNAVVSLRDTLLDEFYIAVRTTHALLEKANPEVYSYQPAEGMRTFMELANHLVQIPQIDLAILQEKSESEVRELEARLSSDTVRDLKLVMEEGYHLLKSYFNSLNDEDFLTKESKAFYAEKPHTQIKWLTEIVTHAYHHRAQLFTYLKQTGHEVNMFDLY